MSAFASIKQELKHHMKEDYLSGITVPEIAIKYGFKYGRAVYFKLQPLTPLDKATHLQAKAKRMVTTAKEEIA